MFEAFFAVILGLVFYKEVPAIKELLGGLLIIFSAYQMNRLSS